MKRKILKPGLLIFLFFAFQGFSGAQSLSVPYEYFSLPNGLQVILHQDNSLPRATVNVWYHVGSSNEIPGRTGLAHLFEHILFEGSQNVPEGKFDQWLEAAGGFNNGSTSNDRTNYYEDFPTNALDLALFLESDRMGYLLQTLTPEKLDGQRDVVKNELRQSYDNRPYGKGQLLLPGLIYPENHPYSWPVIGSIEDLNAATHQDVADFFSTYYSPANAVLVVAGAIDYAETKKKVEHWFGDVRQGNPVSPRTVPAPVLTKEKRVVLEDKVQVPRLTMVWHTPPAYFPGDAEMSLLSAVMSDGKNSRLYKKLVYDLQIASSVYAYNNSKKLNSEFYIIATAKPGVSLSRIEKAIQEEIDLLKKEAPTERETQRVKNQYEASFLRALESVGQKANMLNDYMFYTGNPDYFNEDLQRYLAIDPQDLTNAARYLRDDARVIMSIVPEGKTDLAANKPVN